MISPPPPTTHTVAVVDDDRTCTMMLERILSRAGYRVVVYASGEAVLDAVDATPPSAVCLDLSLPGIDGLETLRQLRARRSDVPVILFTASADDVRAEALAAGAFACVPKTGAWTELCAAVARAVDFRK